MNNYYVYIITDKDKTKLETGLAGELSISLRQLELKSVTDTKDICKYLLHWEGYEDALQAIARERKLKKLSKKKKEALISKNNPGWRFLNEDIYNATPSWFGLNSRI
jgi:putative endonuclease